LIITIGVGIGCRTKDNRSMAKCVDDVVAYGQQPYEEKAREANP